MGARLVAAAAISIAVGGCMIDASIEGKRCPCAPEYACDPVTDTCVRELCSPVVTVSDFRAEWATENTIAFHWTPEGTEQDLLQYELVVAETEDDILTREGTARVLDPATDSDLAFFARPGSTQIVDRAYARDLAAGTTYLARLLATDVHRCTAPSTVVAKRTADAALSEVVLFHDTLPPGAALAPQVGLVAVSGRLQYTPADDPECVPDPGGDPLCGQPVRLQELALDVSEDPANPEGPARIGASTFGLAFLEARVANHGDLDSHFSELWLWLNGCESFADLYEMPNFTLPADETYRTLQVPLSYLFNETGRELTYADLDTSQSGASVCGFGLGAQWNKTGMVWVDEIRIRF
jgi:hypothetical protein